jgi:WD40 repeat protein
MKARADGSGAQALLSKEAGASPAWSPNGDIIATLDSTGLLLINADGSATRHAGDGTWLSITWPKDGNRITGIRRSPERRLELASFDPRSGTTSTRADLGLCPAAFSYAAALGADPVRGASISPDGKAFITSTVDLKSNLWLLSGYKK